MRNNKGLNVKLRFKKTFAQAFQIRRKTDINLQIIVFTGPEASI